MIRGTPESVATAIAEFAKRVPELTPPDAFRFSFTELRDRKAMRAKPWSRLPGIYTYYWGREDLCYIGRAMLSSGLAARVSDHVQESRRGTQPWDDVLDDAGAFGVVFAFRDEHEVWIPSLEVFLIHRFHGALVNRRRA